MAVFVLKITILSSCSIVAHVTTNAPSAKRQHDIKPSPRGGGPGLNKNNPIKKAGHVDDNPALFSQVQANQKRIVIPPNTERGMPGAYWPCPPDMDAVVAQRVSSKLVTRAKTSISLLIV